MLRSKKKLESEDYIRCCLNCEQAVIDENEEYPDTVFCSRCKKDKPANAKCRKYVYDLLKRQPMRHAEIPTLDPELLDL